MAHGFSRRCIIHIGMSEDEGRRYIRASIEAIENTRGKRPIEYSGPDFQETPTPLLAAEGIRYVHDWGNERAARQDDVEDGRSLLTWGQCVPR